MDVKTNKTEAAQWILYLYPTFSKGLWNTAKLLLKNSHCT